MNNERQRERTQNARPAIEDIIANAMSGEARRNALDFTEYLRAHEMVYTRVHCEIHYKGQCACYIYLDGDEQAHEHTPELSPWTVWTAGQYSRELDGVPMDERMKEIARANVTRCVDCGNGCSPGHSETIFGRQFANVCNAAMMFRNPDAETLECIKKLVEMRRRDIDDHSFAIRPDEKSAELFRESGERMFAAVASRTDGRAYDSWAAMLNEALKRATAIKYAKDHRTKQTVVDDLIKQEKAKGIFWIEELVAELESYGKQRDKYPTLESYMPKLAEAYKIWAENTQRKCKGTPSSQGKIPTTTT